MEAIEIKPANADALRSIAEQIQQLSAQYQGAVAALAISYDVPANWQWDGKGLRFVAPPPAPAPNGNGNGHGHAPPQAESEEYST
jgi:hypothetical protein